MCALYAGNSKIQRGGVSFCRCKREVGAQEEFLFVECQREVGTKEEFLFVECRYARNRNKSSA